MFTFIIQFIDAIYLRTLGLFFIFYIASWIVIGIKLMVSRGYEKNTVFPDTNKFSVSVIVPVVDEPLPVWNATLTYLADSLKEIDSEVYVVANGGNGVKNKEYAQDRGFNVISLQEAGKRNAIYEASKHLTKDITVILDSDTFITSDGIKELIKAFNYEGVGGATPRHVIFDRGRNIFRVISDWLEDLRFSEVLSGQSRFGAVSCLPGRLLAIRTDLLKEAALELRDQKFLGIPCVTGDDRFLTSWLLERNWQTIYVPNSLVYTDAPNNLKGFVRQRVRWSRSSVRETIRSFGWLFRYPYTAFTVLTYMIMKWFFFVVLLVGVLSWLGVIPREHYIYFDSILTVIVGTVIGFFVSGFLRQLPHLKRNPSDMKYLPIFLITTFFVLTLVEWYGNLTMLKGGWLTRELHQPEEAIS